MIEEKPPNGTFDVEVLGDPVQCIEAWDNRMSEELRRIRPLLEALTRMQYPNPFTKWVEVLRREAENFSRTAEITQPTRELDEIAGKVGKSL